MDLTNLSMIIMWIPTVRSIESPALLTWSGGGLNAGWTCVGRGLAAGRPQAAHWLE